MKNIHNIKQLKKIAKEVALLVLDISFQAKSAHVGSCLSIADLLTVLYFSKMNLTKLNVNSQRRDRFILSKGHAALALYSVLNKKGIISKRTLETFGKNGGLCEHPEIKDKGIEMTTGSLGHGLAFGIGIALGLKKLGKTDQVFVLISDGECEEGSLWEAALLAPKLQLDNLTVILDYNNWQCFGKVSEVSKLIPLAPKWESFGWSCVEIDGHNIRAIYETLSRLPFEKEKPSIIIASTKMGRGISFIADTQLGHYKIFNKEEYDKAKNELLDL